MRWAERSGGWAAAGWVAAAWVAAGWMALGMAGTVSPAWAQSAAPDAVLDRVLRDPRIQESSGLAVSRRHDGVLWTHNDSGDDAHLYAIGPDGSTLATVTLAGLDPRDWEAMASSIDSDGTPLLWVGDIGDNYGTRNNGILVHRIAEPSELQNTEVQPTSYRLRYPGPPVDAESLLVDPRDGRLFVITKAPVGGTVYAAPPVLDPTGANLLESLGDSPDFLTDGAFAADGRMVVRGYGAMWAGSPAAGWSGPVSLPPSDQGESLAVSGDGTAGYVGSEGTRSEIWRVPLPAALSADVPPGFTDDQTPDPAKAYGSGLAVPLLAGGFTVMLGLVLLLVRGRRSRS